MPGTSTLLLDRSSWDLTLNAAGNIAVAASPYSLGQDAASVIRTFLGEVYFDTTLGLPYKTQILGFRPPIALLKAKLKEAALTVPGVSAAKVFLTAANNRVVSGQVQVTATATKKQSAANFSVVNPQGAG